MVFAGLQGANRSRSGAVARICNAAGHKNPYMPAAQEVLQRFPRKKCPRQQSGCCVHAPQRSANTPIRTRQAAARHTRRCLPGAGFTRCHQNPGDAGSGQRAVHRADARRSRSLPTKALARALGCKSVQPCTPQVALRHTGYLVGGTAPFATRRAMPVYIERSILALERIAINGGRRGLLLQMPPQVCAQLLQAQPVDCAQ